MKEVLGAQHFDLMRNNGYTIQFDKFQGSAADAKRYGTYCVVHYTKFATEKLRKGTERLKYTKTYLNDADDHERVICKVFNEFVLDLVGSGIDPIEQLSAEAIVEASMVHMEPGSDDSD